MHPVGVDDGKKHSRGSKVLFVYCIAVAMPLSDLEKKKTFQLVESFFHRPNCEKVFCVTGRPSCPSVSYELALALQNNMVKVLRQAHDETPAEQAAVLLDFPKRLQELQQWVCIHLETVKLPPLPPVAPDAAGGKIHSLPPDSARRGHVKCCLQALSGENVAEIFVRRERPWLEEVPFGRLCHLWGIRNFELLSDEETVFPKPPPSPARALPGLRSDPASGGHREAATHHCEGH